MHVLQAGSNALSLFFGLNLDRILFFLAVIAALVLAGFIITVQTAGPTII